MLRHQIARITRDSGADLIAASYYDLETHTAWSYHGDHRIHAASTIKVALLAVLFEEANKGRFDLGDRLHVRNRFLSAKDGAPFHLDPGRDADSEVHAAIGKSMRLRDLAYHMITTSSNLATNLLLDFVGVDTVRQSLDRHGIKGVDLVRGVEDERAYEAGINNYVTANGLIRLFRLIQDSGVYPPQSSGEMIDILLKQEFRSGIPAGLPTGTRVAHKTGEISTVAHDAGIVFLPERAPYYLAILTEWSEDVGPRRDVVAQISRLVYDYLTSEDASHA